MTTDNRANEPTPEQVEAAAKVLRADEGFMAEVHSALEVSWSEYIARLVLVAARGAAPQAESDYSPTPGKRLTPEFRADIVEAARERIQTVWNDVPEGVDALTLAQNIVAAQEFFWLSLHFPVLPSSGVDVDALAEVVRKSENAWRKATGPTTRHEWIARAVAEWLENRAAEIREGK